MPKLQMTGLTRSGTGCLCQYGNIGRQRVTKAQLTSSVETVVNNVPIINGSEMVPGSPLALCVVAIISAMMVISQSVHASLLHLNYWSTMQQQQQRWWRGDLILRDR